VIGIIPAAGCGTRIQPLGCSKELLPVGSHHVNGAERPKAIAEYLIERMINAGAQQICMIISPEKHDLIRFFSERHYAADIFYAVQNKPAGLCDAVFRTEPFIGRHEQVLIGLPDTIWFPANSYASALDFSQSSVNLIAFPVADPTQFDSVLFDGRGMVQRVDVKSAAARSKWIWGAIAATGDALRSLKELWQRRGASDIYLGDLFNAFIAEGNPIRAVPCGETYIDVGTVNGYHRAQDFMRAHRETVLAA
jgi:glucose-1-phosphate thymidylyltransferase